jgi:rod shape-determining protein MreB
MNPLRDRIFRRIGKELAIDLGTANTLVYMKDRGIVINEPSVVAINRKTGQIIEIGHAAKQMVGKTPQHIAAIKPLTAGVISDFEITEQMLRYFFQEVQGDDSYVVPRPRAVIGIPSAITDVEKRAVEEAARNAGAREVHLIEEPMAAAIGARLPIFEAMGTMIVDIGGGTTEIAVISLGGLVSFTSLRTAGDKMNEDIVSAARDRYNMLLGERSAEEVKIAIGSATLQSKKIEAHVRGRDLVTGLPKELVLSSKDIMEALEPSVRAIILAVQEIIEDTPPELIADIIKRGIYLTGGGSLLTGFDELLAKKTGIVVRVVDDPLTAVVRGAGIVLENLEEHQDLLVNRDYLTSPRE